MLPDVLHTSLLRRAITTANLALDEADRHWIPVRRDWRLNERHYGALQGKDKKATMEQYGEEQFMLWRRSFDTPPPPIEADDEFSQAGDPRYADLGAAAPATECLKDVIERLLPYWDEAIVPDLRTGKVVCVAAHGNSLRAMVKHLDGISDADIAGLNIPTGIPLVYRLDEDLSRCSAAGSTSTPRPPRTRSPPWPTRAADPGRDTARRTPGRRGRVGSPDPPPAASATYGALAQVARTPSSSADTATSSSAIRLRCTLHVWLRAIRPSPPSGPQRQRQDRTTHVGPVEVRAGRGRLQPGRAVPEAVQRREEARHQGALEDAAGGREVQHHEQHGQQRGGPALEDRGAARGRSG